MHAATDIAERDTAILRLVRGVAYHHQTAIREWSGEIADPAQRDRLLALVYGAPFSS
jgi:hypothetical protein